MNYSEMMQLADEFNAHEPTELIMQYRYWEDDPGKRMLIMPADFASDKFMVKDKGIYARYVYSNDHTDEEVIKALIADKFKFYHEFCDMYLESIIDTDGGLNDTDGND